MTDDVQDLVITPNGRWLIATSAAGTAVYSYSIDAGTGELGTEVALNLAPPVAIRSIAVDPEVVILTIPTCGR